MKTLKIYLDNKTGIIKHCYSLDDMNFNIVGYCEISYLPIPVECQNVF